MPDSSSVPTANTIAVVNAAITLLAAIVAIVSARIARAALNDQKTARRDERDALYYRVLVVDGGVAAIRSYGDRVRKAITDGRERIASLPAGSAHSDFELETSQVWEHITTHYTALSDQLLVSARVWGDAGIVRNVARALEDVQDSLLEEVQKLALTNAQVRPEKLNELVSENIVRLTVAIVHPAIGKRSELPRSREGSRGSAST
jgi:hypothetical protein